ncbi:response regulator [Streptomyces sp. OF3]|uniref:Response regulator n=1 Tax=Streptomyces alkaliterrae TaxID=2213162 RepID=A0A5P0YXF8_9ACTN|nr:response regulator [Streptomyces alkaliterrae]MBB1260984.1 response regulator [Streptomyces alkaliterrae]MQS04973.1 response regulator [Streptomyces alkaliterrae]
MLVVDDEPHLREQLTQTFLLAGYRVTCAAGGVQALNAAVAEPPDLVVLDVGLPDIDGWEVARQLRRLGRGGPVLFLTTGPAPTEADDPLGEFGGRTGDARIPKPLRLEEVVRRASEALAAENAEGG